MTDPADSDAPTHDRESWDDQSTEDAYPAEDDACSCKPGTHADGWQERRGPACERAELDMWRDMLARYHANQTRVIPPDEGQA